MKYEREEPWKSRISYRRDYLSLRNLNSRELFGWIPDIYIRS